jgi:hypothetical protein
LAESPNLSRTIAPGSLISFVSERTAVQRLSSKQGVPRPVADLPPVPLCGIQRQAMGLHPFQVARPDSLVRAGAFADNFVRVGRTGDPAATGSVASEPRRRTRKRRQGPRFRPSPVWSRQPSIQRDRPASQVRRMQPRLRAWLPQWISGSLGGYSEPIVIDCDF